MENELNVLASRAGFNTALRHFKNVTSYVTEMGEGHNLADLINDSLDSGVIKRFQVKTILSALLVDKFAFAYRSHNFLDSVEKIDRVVESVSEWGAIHIVLAYFHPQAGVYVINPKNSAHWEEVLPLIKDELAVIYSGAVEGEPEQKVLHSAIRDFINILYGKKIKPKKEYGTANRTAPVQAPVSPAPPPLAPAAPAPAAPTGKRRVTPRYSVQVTNELFHNGNVEAWKKIVESYKTTYQGLDVLIWYENERINDINALFKWGKVKHGGLIFFSVAGETITGVSKLQRYLFEGASPRFEVFLRGGIGEVLDLF
jgi:hypothetical protein